MTRSYRFISEHRAVFGVTRLCRVLGVRRPGFYEWLAAAPARAERVAADEGLAAEIAEVHAGHRGAYGRPRIVVALRRRGLEVNHKRVGRVMRERGIAGLTRRRRRSLTRPDIAVASVPDLISRDFTAPAPGRRLVGDITYLPTREGWLYLATVIDLHTREVIGHAMADHTRAELVRDALDLAASRGLTDDGAIFHADRGTQYSSGLFRRALACHGIRPSAGRAGSCYDNAVAESFFATLKTEIGTTVWDTRDDARRDVFAYLGYYNHDRLHSTLDYRTPHETRIDYRQGHTLVA
ncbi:IS3 family transposase [Actinokineospora auranticolor]|uniref:Transposase InsO family protein n=1 Tax=Actinokineospora auranticolor TaxID=155976 RepID=A0A2S6GLS3_9PSEU|nr:IS3 family transposase [Actinokineospora auranticolor]PPK66184.1 transposase InsO family protein [Actinokineospora auranticolor]